MNSLKHDKRRALTDNDLDVIQSRYEAGESSYDLARDFPASNGIICKWLKRRGVPMRPTGRQSRFHHEQYFQHIDSGEKAYILGFFYADGCNTGSGLDFSLHIRDEEIVRKIRDRICKDVPIRKRVRPSVEMARFRLCGQVLSNRLSELGCVQRKALVLKYPQWMPNELHSHFIRGYFDGDGTIWIHKQGEREGHPGLAFSSTLSFLSTVKDIIQNTLGIRGVLCRKRRLDLWSTCHLNYSDFYNVITIYSWMLKDAHIYMKRKYDKFCEIEQDFDRMETVAQEIERGKAADIIEMKASYESGEPCRKIATNYPVCGATVWNWLKEAGVRMRKTGPVPKESVL